MFLFDGDFDWDFLRGERKCNAMTWIDSIIASRLNGVGHTNEEIPFDLKALVTRGIIVVQRNLYGNKKGRGACSMMSNTLPYRESVDFIRAGILSGRPFMAGKVGTGDNETMLRYMDIHDKEACLLKWFKLLVGRRRPFWWDNSIRAGIGVCAGVFPPTVEGIEEFCRIYETYLPEMDGFASCADGETRIHDRYCPKAVPITWDSLFPVFRGYTWMDALRGKRVLVVHPFVKTIVSQYEKAREVELHKNQGPFPDFDLLVYKPVNSIGGKNSEFSSWNDALRSMEKDLSKLNFDVALIGCGVYGVPLSAHVKRMGRAAVHTGGTTQLLFGIKARRFDHWNCYNENWVHPMSDDVPPNLTQIEGGSFL